MNLRDIKSKSMAEAAWREVMANREEIIKAFIAKYGCGPEEAMQEIGRLTNSRMTWRIRILTEAEKEAAKKQQVQRDLDLLKAAPGPHVFLSIGAWFWKRLFQLPGCVYLSELGARTAAGKDGVVRKVKVRA